MNLNCALKNVSVQSGPKKKKESFLFYIALLTLLMMTAESMLSKRQVLRFTVDLLIPAITADCTAFLTEKWTKNYIQSAS